MEMKFGLLADYAAADQSGKVTIVGEFKVCRSTAKKVGLPNASH